MKGENKEKAQKLPCDICKRSLEDVLKIIDEPTEEDVMKWSPCTSRCWIVCPICYDIISGISIKINSDLENDS